MFQTFIDNFIKNFIVERRYMLVVEGIGNTFLLTIIAAIVGIVIGINVAKMNLSHTKSLRFIAKVYIDIIRGTPVVTQLMVLYFVIFASVPKDYALLIAGLSFGINSGAYVAEIIRAGILSIDIGQMEAGRSLGLTKRQTMKYIIMPQAYKNVMPALANEFIVLMKETAVVSLVAVQDIMKAFSLISSTTYQATMPYLAAAVIYYIILKGFTILFRKIEERMRKADQR